MAKVVVTIKIMPESPESSLQDIEAAAKEIITRFVGETEFKVEIEPVAFGLNALNIFFVMDEKFGSTDPIEDQIRQIEGVNSVEAVDVRRTIG